jgi:hypothetical protein
MTISCDLIQNLTPAASYTAFVRYVAAWMVSKSACPVEQQFGRSGLQLTPPVAQVNGTICTTRSGMTRVITSLSRFPMISDCSSVISAQPTVASNRMDTMLVPRGPEVLVIIEPWYAAALSPVNAPLSASDADGCQPAVGAWSSGWHSRRPERPAGWKTSGVIHLRRLSVNLLQRLEILDCRGALRVEQVLARTNVAARWPLGAGM